jgi:hypothetical protein
MKIEDIVFERSIPVATKSKNLRTLARRKALKNMLSRAKFVANAIKDGKKPGDDDLINDLEVRMGTTPGLNPLAEEDTYGVQLMFNYLFPNDKNFAKRAKQFYNSMIDQWVKEKASKNNNIK